MKAAVQIAKEYGSYVATLIHHLGRNELG